MAAETKWSVIKKLHLSILRSSIGKHLLVFKTLRIKKSTTVLAFVELVRKEIIRDFVFVINIFING